MPDTVLIDLADIGSGNVSTTGGSQTRDLADKLGDFLSIKDYGDVKGDNSTDDEAQIEAANNAAAGAPIFWPPGTYTVGNTLNITTKANWIAPFGGVTIKLTGSATAVMFVNDTASGSTFQGITFDGNDQVTARIVRLNTNCTDVSFIGGKITNTGSDTGDAIDGIDQAGGNDRILIRDVEFEQVFNGVRLEDDCEDWTVEQCLFEQYLRGIYGEWAAGENARNISIRGNRFGQFQNHTAQKVAIDLSATDAYPVQNVEVTGNRPLYPFGAFPATGASANVIRLRYAEGGVVADNFIDGGGDVGIEYGNSRYLVIENNLITRCDGAALNDGASGTEDGRDNITRNNTVINCGIQADEGAADASAAPIRGWYSTRAHFSGNRVICTVAKVKVTGGSGTFIRGEIITGGTSSETAVVEWYDATNGNIYVRLETADFAFTGTETLTGGTSGATATFASIQQRVNDYAYSIKDANDVTFEKSNSCQGIKTPFVMQGTNTFGEFELQADNLGAVGDGTTSDTGIFNNAFEALTEANGGGRFFLGDKTYLTPGLVPKPGITVQGRGKRSSGGSCLQTSSGDLITITEAANDFSLRDLRLEATATGGHLVEVSSIWGGGKSMMAVEMRQRNPAKSGIYCLRDGTGIGLYGFFADGCEFYHDTSATVPFIDIDSTTGSPFQGNSLRDCYYWDGSASTPFISIDMNASGTSDKGNIFSGNFLEKLNGGWLHMYSAVNTVVTGTTCYDITGNVVGHMISFDRQGSNQFSRNNQVIGYDRSSGTLSGAVDINLGTGSQGAVLQGIDGGASSGVTIDLNSTRANLFGIALDRVTVNNIDLTETVLITTQGELRASKIVLTDAATTDPTNAGEIWDDTADAKISAG